MQSPSEGEDYGCYMRADSDVMPAGSWSGPGFDPRITPGLSRHDAGFMLAGCHGSPRFDPRDTLAGAQGLP